MLQDLHNALDRMDVLLTTATLMAESDQHKPGPRELKYFADTGTQILDEILQAIGPEEEEVNGENAG